MRFVSFLATILVGALALPGRAATIPYQGLATDASNVPVPDKTHEFGFALYSDSTGTKELWTEAQSVATRKGLFAVELGAKTPIPEKVLRSGDPFLAVNLGDGEIKPRLRLGRVPRAIHAIAADTASFASKAAGIDAILARLTALEDRRAKDSSRTAQLEALLKGVSRDGREIRFDSLNVSVRNGLGRTDTVNGLGNLIVGYNAIRGITDIDQNTHFRTGSHMIVMGDRNSYSSYGGIVAGKSNVVTGIYSSILGGESNTASGKNSAIVAGIGNAARGGHSATVGGQGNEARGTESATLGGTINTTIGRASAVGGSSSIDLVRDGGFFPSP